MLVSFVFENWKSFRGCNKINFVAGRKQTHRETLMEVPNYRGLRLLPISGIWGGNAGGKTNLLEALKFVKDFVSTGYNQQRYIPVEAFRPRSTEDEQPSYFAVTFLVDTRIYQLEFSLTSRRVVEENLYWLTHTREWRAIYERTTDDQGNAQVEFSDAAAPELPTYRKRLDQLKACAIGCGPYRLFLTNTVDQRIDTFAPIVDWFTFTLRYAGAGTQFTRFSKMMSDEHYCRLFGSILNAMDTGVEKVTLEDIDYRDIWSALRDDIRNDVQQHDDGTMQIEMGLHSDAPREVYLLTKSQGRLQAKRVQTYRRDDNGELRPFGFRNESSGTRRLLEVLPVFTDLWGGNSECIWLLDEIDKEFHTDLTRALIEQFLLRTDAASRRQMLFTTHDLMLMEQSLMRIDEINVVERRRNGESVLIPLHEYKGLRNDKDLRKSYLEGRFGGVPRLSPITIDFDDAAETPESESDDER